MILSAEESSAPVREAFLAGAHAYVVKSADPGDLRTAIREVLAGRYVAKATGGDLPEAVQRVHAGDAWLPAEVTRRLLDLQTEPLPTHR